MRAKDSHSRPVRRSPVLWLLLCLAMNVAVASLTFAQAAEERSGQSLANEMGGMGSMPMHEGMTCTCASSMMQVMQGPLVMAMVVLASLVLAAVVATLGALTLFLVRRSRSPSRGAVT